MKRIIIAIIIVLPICITSNVLAQSNSKIKSNETITHTHDGSTHTHSASDHLDHKHKHKPEKSKKSVRSKSDKQSKKTEAFRKEDQKRTLQHLNKLQSDIELKFKNKTISEEQYLKEIDKIKYLKDNIEKL